MIIYYDIDNTLTSPVESKWTPDLKTDPSWTSLKGRDWIMRPDPDALEELVACFNEGHEVVIWSCRTNPAVMGHGTVAELVEKVRDWLSCWSIPYTRIELTPKPFFTYLVDDRALNPLEEEDRLRLRYSMLKKFAVHMDDCKSGRVREPWEEDLSCTCGLADHLNQDWALGLKGSVRGGSQEP